MSLRQLNAIGMLICVMALSALRPERAYSTPLTRGTCAEMDMELLAGVVAAEDGAAGNVEYGTASVMCETCIWLCIQGNDECNGQICNWMGCSTAWPICIEDMFGCPLDKPDRIVCP